MMYCCTSDNQEKVEKKQNKTLNSSPAKTSSPLAWNMVQNESCEIWEQAKENRNRKY